MTRLLLVGLALTAAFSASAAPGGPVPIAGTRVRLIVPEGFVVAPEFPGIGRDEDLTSILVTELPVPLHIAREGFTAKALAARGIEVQRSGPVLVSGHRALLIHASQRAAGIDFRKWLLLLGDDHSSVLLTATTPLDLESRHQEALVSALSSAEWSPEAEREPDPALHFTVREPPPLRIVTSAENALVLSDPGYDGSDGSAAPFVSVGASRAQVQIQDLAAFSRQRLRESVGFDEIAVLDEAERTLAGLPAYRIRADARDTATGRDVRVLQVLGTDGSRYYLVQGVAERSAGDDFEGLFDRVVEGFALREAPPRALDAPGSSG